MAGVNPTAIALSLQRVPISLRPDLKEEDYKLVTIQHGVGNQKRKAEIPSINRNDAELICKATLEFEDAARPSRLNLTTAALLYDKFREVTKGAFRTKFDELRNAHPPNVAGFHQAKDAFILHYLKDTALADEQAYLESVKKPFKLSVPDLGERLLEINRVMAKFPGANGVSPYTEQQLKTVFYKMMLDLWKVNFSTSVNRLHDPTYGFLDLVHYMETQALAHDARQRATQTTVRGGRGGRGGGRDQRRPGRHPNTYRRLEYGGRSSGYREQNSQQYGRDDYYRRDYYRPPQGRSFGGRGGGRYTGRGRQGYSGRGGGSGRYQGRGQYDGGRTGSNNYERRSEQQYSEQYQQDQEYYDDYSDQYNQDQQYQDEDQHHSQDGQGEEETKEEVHWMDAPWY